MLDQNTRPATGPSASEKRILTDLLKAEKLDQATRYTEKLLQAYPGNTLLLKGLGMLHQLNGDTRAAAEILQQQIGRALDDTAALERLGQCQTDLGEHEAALATWQKLLQLAPDSLAGLCGLGSTYNLLELYHRAADQFEQALALAPDNDEIAEVLANTYLESRQYDRAAAHYQTLLPKRPKDGRLLLNLSDALSHIDCIEEALTVCAQAIKADPKLARAHVLKGNIYAMTGDTKKAQASLAKALKLEPDNVPALSAVVHKTKITKANAGKYMPALEKILPSGRSPQSRRRFAPLRWARRPTT